tara:strand:+ start:87420 stop:88448 length:1029 start_codon:yes stop_codon:yes gene_type:complete
MTKLIFKEIKEINEAVLKIKSDQLLIIIDQSLWTLYKSKLSFLTANTTDKKIIVWKAPSGEDTKNLDEYAKAQEYFIEKGIHRKSHLLAIGGGATSDFAGFVAATILRGISWSIIPTTLLSQVDASIGGKVAVNTNNYKNLIGAFHIPENVFISSEFFKTLPESEFNSGLGEVIKYAFLSDGVKDFILKGSGLDKVIKKCSEYKLELTQRDLKESGERKLLNLGHTFGHGLEKIYNLPHGVAVYWGMALIFKVFDKNECLDLLRTLSAKLEVEFGEEPWLNRTFPVKKIMSHISKDKKVLSTTKIELLLPEKNNEITIQPFELSELEEKLEIQKNELRKFKL